MRSKLFLLGLLVVGRAGMAPVLAEEITPAGERLAQLLDSLDVDRRWLPGHPVHWRTGTIDPGGRQSATHCSTFVAAVCDRLGVYILRPPDHSQVLLANAQNRWLRTAGAEQGWSIVETPEQAQHLANFGALVIVSYHNPDPHRPGHIAVVRPSRKGPRAIAEEGPQIIQAGKFNARSIPLNRGFSRHIRAGEGRAIEYFAHPPIGERANRHLPPPPRVDATP